MTMSDARPSPSPSLPLLIVDDENEICDLLRDVFEEEGFTVLTTSNGAAALSLLQRTPVALVVTDLMMPQLSGFELAQRLRSNPQTATIPLILMSAAMPQQLSDLFVLVIQKPFAIEAIVRAVNQVVAP
jgi:CheY-like chemotaxis protein